MKALLLFFILSSLSTLSFAATPPSQPSDAFHGPNFGPSSGDASQKRQQQVEAPSWSKPEQTPLKQKMEEVPRERLNEWQENAEAKDREAL